MFDRRHFLSLGLGAGAVLAAPAAIRAQAPITARTGFIPVLGTAPLFVAEAQGWLKDKGLALRPQAFESGPHMIQALASGTLDIYVAGVSPLIVARSKGLDVRVVAATAIEEMQFIAGPKLAPFFKPGIGAAEAFRAYRAASGAPARLATQPLGSVPNTTLQHWLWQVTGTAKEDVSLVPMGIDATQQAVLVGAVEGGTVREPTSTILTSRSAAIRVVAQGSEMFADQPGTVVAVSGTFIERHPALVQGLVDGLIRSAKLIQTAPEQAAPVMAALLGKGLVDPATILAALKSPASKFIVDPQRIVAATGKMQTFQVSIGALERELPLEGVFEPRFYLASSAV